jgi:hypothetical protein
MANKHINKSKVKHIPIEEWEDSMLLAKIRRDSYKNPNQEVITELVKRGFWIDPTVLKY